MVERADGASLMELVAALDDTARTAWLAELPAGVIRRLVREWSWWERPGQRAPMPPWRTWLVMAGRGFGKTRIGAEWVRAAAEAQVLRIALVGATLGEARRVMVEGESGLLAIAPPDLRPDWQPSLGRLTWPGGSVATVFSAAEPDSLRGAQHHLAWADEIAKWPHAEVAWDNLALTLRIGDCPRVVATTTPRPVPLIRRLLADPAVAVTRGSTADNRANLASGFLQGLEQVHRGTRWARQELDGEMIDDVAGALWTRDVLETCRADTLPALNRVVVGVDPPAGIGGDACGIVAVGRAGDGRGYVLEDASVQGASPEGWARAVAACARRVGADRVVAEANNGGEMVRSTLLAAQAGLPVTLVHASRGKTARAEPIAVLYQADRMRHFGAMPVLEDELCGMGVGGDYAGPGRSPDRADALVWAATALMLDGQGEARVRGL